MTWAFPSWVESNSDMPLAVGADMSAGTLAQAHSLGYYPTPPADEFWEYWHEEKYGPAVDAGEIPVLGGLPRFSLPWWSPAQRAVLLAENARLSQSIRRALRNIGWTTTMDLATRTVIENCGPRRGEQTWLSPGLAEGYIQLAEQGMVHSVEVWDVDGDLIGGSFGVLSGTVFTAESGFRTRDNVPRIALLEALIRLRDAGGDFVDVQLKRGYLPSVGVIEISKREFHERLDAGRHTQLELPKERRNLDRVLAVGR